MPELEPTLASIDWICASREKAREYRERGHTHTRPGDTGCVCVCREAMHWSENKEVENA